MGSAQLLGHILPHRRLVPRGSRPGSSARANFKAGRSRLLLRSSLKQAIAPELPA